MQRGGWVVRRSGVRFRLLAALTALTFTITVLITAIIGMSQRDAADGVRNYLSGVDDSAAVTVVSTSLAPDTGKQSAAFDSLVAAQFGELPVISMRRLVSGAYSVTSDDAAGSAGSSGRPAAAGRSLRLGSYDGFTGHARITAGNWPAASSDTTIGVAVQAKVAAEWSLRPGDPIEVVASSGTTKTLRVAAIFQPDASPFWRADTTLVAGSGVADPSPVLVVDPQVLTAGGSSPSVSWTLVPDIAKLRPEQVAPMAAAVGRLPAAVRDDRAVNINGALFGGGLAGTFDVLQGSLDAAVVAQPLPIMLVVAFGLVMVFQIGRLMTADRRSETALLTSRGLSARRVSWWAAVEGAVCAVIGAALALPVAAIFAPIPAAGPWIAAAAVLVAVLACAFPAWRDGAAPLTRDRLDDAGRGRVVVAGGLLVLLAGAAAFAVWRFRRGGADAVTDVDGRRVLDPAVLLAPPVTLVALAAIAVVVFGLLTTVAERASATSTTGLTGVLPIRQIARRRTVFGAAVMLIALAVGGCTVAAGYASTTAEHQRITEQLANGSDVRVVTPGSSLSPFAAFADPVAAYRALPGLKAGAAVLRADASAGDTPVTVVGVPAGALPALTERAPGYDPTAMSKVLRTAASDTDLAAATAAQDAAAHGVPLPERTTGLSVQAKVNAAGNAGESVTLTPTAWLLTPDGGLAPVSLGRRTVRVATASTLTLKAELTDVPNGTRLLAIDLQIPGVYQVVKYQIALTVQAITPAGTKAVQPAGWTVQQGAVGSVVDGTPAFSTSTDGLGFSGEKQDLNTDTQPATVRLMPPADGRAAVPAVVDTALMQALSLQRGDRISVALPGMQIPIEISDAVDQIPGYSGTGLLLTDLPTLQTAVLRAAVVAPATSEIWLSTGDPAAAVVAARALAGPGAAVTGVGAGSVDVLLRPAVRALWWGTGGALLLAAVAMLLVMATLARNRRAELAVLRALGVSAAAQARMRRRELLSTAVPAWIFGLAAGFGTALLIVPGLARQAVVGGSATLNPPLQLAWETWGLLIGAHVVLVLLAIGRHSLVVRRHAGTADPREVTA